MSSLKSNRISTFIFLFSLALSCGLTLPAFAEDDDTPASFGIFPPIQYPDEEATVTGIRINAGCARHKNVYGLDFGTVCNITDQRFIGMALAGGFNRTSGDTYAIFTQMALGANHNTGNAHIFGIQYALGANISGKSTRVYGAQVAVGANTGGAAHIYGIQISAYNRAENIYGFQVGVMNFSKNVYGFQIGLINRTENLHGVQIGLINTHEKGWIKHMPIINIGF